MGHRMSENEKALWFCILFPPLWPLGFACILVWCVEGITGLCVKAWRKLRGGLR